LNYRPGPGSDLHAFLRDGVTVHDLGPATDVEHPVMWTPGQRGGTQCASVLTPS
jgi:hypothetical protein